MREKPSVLTRIRSAANDSSIAWSTDFEIAEAKVATKVTSATPIMSAAAVVVVRLGFRSVFSRARRPVTPRRRSSGQPTIDAIGLIRRFDSIATPMNSMHEARAEELERRAGAVGSEQADSDRECAERQAAPPR